MDFLIDRIADALEASPDYTGENLSSDAKATAVAIEEWMNEWIETSPLLPNAAHPMRPIVQQVLQALIWAIHEGELIAAQ